MTRRLPWRLVARQNTPRLFVPLARPPQTNCCRFRRGIQWRPQRRDLSSVVCSECHCCVCQDEQKQGNAHFRVKRRPSFFPFGGRTVDSDNSKTARAKRSFLTTASCGRRTGRSCSASCARPSTERLHGKYQTDASVCNHHISHVPPRRRCTLRREPSGR